MDRIWFGSRDRTCSHADLLLSRTVQFAIYLSTYALTLVGKIMCYALVALSLDLVWGYCGVLSLGHGLFFALGGYAMGMYLMRSIGLDGVYHSPLPISWYSSIGRRYLGFGRDPSTFFMRFC